MHRTVRVKLDVPDGAGPSLKRTIEQFTWAVNFIIRAACAGRESPITSDRRLHDLTYSIIRDKTALQSNVVISARNHAIREITRYVDRRSRGESTTIPSVSSEYAVYGSRSARLSLRSASLSTVDGRVEVDYIIPVDDEGTPHRKYLFNEDFSITGATLHPRDDDWYLHLGLSADDSRPSPAGLPGLVMGVDLNVTGSLAVTSTGAFLGSADELHHQRELYEERRASLQKTGTQSANRTIASIGSRFARYSTDLLHRLSKELVAEAMKHDCGYIVFEDLTDIRERISNHPRFQHWFFNQLISFSEYKAAEQGLLIREVNPAYTSKRCSRCGTVEHTDRTHKRFECSECGYRNDADYNAAKNIGHKFVRRGQTSPDGRATRRLALKSGSVNGNGEYTPTPEGV